MNTLTKKSSEPKMKKKKSKDNSGSGKVRRVLSKISGAFMLPIAIMAIAGLLLGVGATIISVFQGYIADVPQSEIIQKASSIARWQNVVTVGEFIRAIGEPVFGALPLLFAAAFVIAFTDEAGVAVFATIIAYLTFVSLQSVFITPITETIPGTIATPAVPASFDANGNILKAAVPAIPATKITGYQIIFTQAGRDPSRLFRLVTRNLGLRSLDTSVFGGIVVGLIVQKLYNRFHTIQLPAVISFFGGKRFVAIISILFMIPTSLLFLIFWPWIGIGLNIFGSSLSKVPYGFESLIFGFIERSLVPFGLHHVFYAPLWYSPIGGDLNDAINRFNSTGVGSEPGFVASDNLKIFFSEVSANPTAFQGDSLISINLTGIRTDRVSYSIPIANGQIETRDYALYNFVAAELGIKVGRFLNGKYSFMMMGLPAAGLAMIFAAPKENRKVAVGAVLPAIFTSMITGVTEPIEFTFLFLAPWLFWGFHAVMCALSFWFANLLGVHTGSAFSGGFLDLLIYGIAPVRKGTQFWWSFVVGGAYVPIYFIVFYFSIKKFNLETPGRGNNVKLFLKSDFLNKKSKKLVAAGVGVVDASVESETTSEEEQIDPKALAVVRAYGGLSNITAFNNCASRLRYDVVDADLVDASALKATGAAGVKVEGKTHVQAIYGPVAEQLNAKIKSLRPQIARWEAKQVLLAQEEKQGKDPVEIQKPIEQPIEQSKPTNLPIVAPKTEVQNPQKSLEDLEFERRKYQNDRRSLYDFEALLLADKLRKIEAEIAFMTQEDPIDKLEKEVNNINNIEPKLSQEDKRYLADLEALRMATILEQQKNQDSQHQNSQQTEEFLDQQPLEQDLFEYEISEQERREYQLLKRRIGDYEALLLANALKSLQPKTQPKNPVPQGNMEEPKQPIEQLIDEQQHELFDAEAAEQERKLYQHKKRFEADSEAQMIVNQSNATIDESEEELQQLQPQIESLIEAPIEEVNVEQQPPFDIEAAEKERQQYQQQKRQIADFEAQMILRDTGALDEKLKTEEDFEKEAKAEVKMQQEKEFDYEAAEKDRKQYQLVKRYLGDIEAEMIVSEIGAKLDEKEDIEEESEEIKEEEQQEQMASQPQVEDTPQPMPIIEQPEVEQQEPQEPFDFEAAEKARQQHQQDKRYVADIEAKMLAEATQSEPQVEEPQVEQTPQPMPQVEQEVQEEQAVEEVSEPQEPFDFEGVEKDRQNYQQLKRYIGDKEALMLVNATQSEPQVEEPKIEEVSEPMPVVEQEVQEEQPVEEVSEPQEPFDFEGAEKERQQYQIRKRYFGDVEALMLADAIQPKPQPEPEIEEPQVEEVSEPMPEVEQEIPEEPQVEEVSEPQAEIEEHVEEEIPEEMPVSQPPIIMPIVEEPQPEVEPEVEETPEEQPVEEVSEPQEPFDFEGAEKARKQYQKDKRYVGDIEAGMLADATQSEPEVEPEIEEPQPEVEEETPLVEEVPIDGLMALREALKASALVEEQQHKDEEPVEEEPQVEEPVEEEPQVEEEFVEEQPVEEEQPEVEQDDLFYETELEEDEVEEVEEAPEETVDEELNEIDEIFEDEPVEPAESPIIEPVVESVPQPLAPVVEEPIVAPIIEEPISPQPIQKQPAPRPVDEGEFSIYRPIVNSIGGDEEVQPKPMPVKELPKEKEVKEEKPKQPKVEKQPKPAKEPKPVVAKPPVEKVKEPKVVPPVVAPEEDDDDEVEVITEDDGTQKTRLKDQIVFAPAIGKLRTLKSLRDGEFSEGAYGEGFAVRFSADKIGRVYAPFDAKVTHVSDSKHKYVIKSRKGVEVTLQIGIGSEALEGEGFKSSVNEGQQVKAGDLIVTVDLELIKKSRLRNDLIFAVSPNSRRTQVKITKEEKDITRVAAEVAKVSKVSE